MRNAALPRDLAVQSAPPVPARRFWRSRRRRLAVVPAAPVGLLRREVGHGRVGGHPTADQPVLVHDVSLSSVDLRSRLPLDVCGHYRLHSDAHGPLLHGSRVRVVSCQREPNGLYAVGAIICR